MPKREKERGGRARQTVSLLSEVIIMRVREWEWDPKNFPFQKRYFHPPENPPQHYRCYTFQSIREWMWLSQFDLFIINLRVPNLILSVILLSLIPVGAVADLVSGGDNNSNFKLNR